MLGKGIGWAKTNPIQAALTGLGIGGLLRGGLGDEEEEEITFEKVYGSAILSNEAYIKMPPIISLK